MTDDRRYTDEEVEEIFRSAAADTKPGRDLPARSGLTLAELQAIGREVGMPPEQIAEAAARLDRRPAPLPRRKILGMPVSVGRTVELPRAPTDREWSIVVGELREVFQAHGRESAGPGSRSWRNGNLHAVVEPTVSGYRLRMGTRKSDAAASAAMGVFLAVAAVLLLLGMDDAGELLTPVLLALVAVGTVSFNAVRLPAWASEREEQMEYVAGRMLALLAHPPAGP
ncbi:MAG TPA: hypothetical protein VHG51_21065 [Longimicrobiaceae bacterium]|nr:hypothetical protein [Longimicrobiaceae bacterium]